MKTEHEQQTEETSTTTTRAQTVLIRSATKAYALKVSKEKRAGKFERVGESFFLSCEADFEAVIRRISSSISTAVPPDPGVSFITKLARDKAEEKLEEIAKIIIYGHVMRHPSLGKTLKD